MSDTIMIDVLTLDSLQCAACTYMMESIAALPQQIQDVICYREWSIKTRAGVDKFVEMKGRVLPTIAIQGDLIFESMIPQYEDLIDAMAERAPTEELGTAIRDVRGIGFDFEQIETNLAKARSD
ncbi:MAG: hypothetical protein V1792_22100 [Pseudomonadota bacterium]